MRRMIAGDTLCFDYGHEVMSVKQCVAYSNGRKC
jgi:hypothetical protein